MAYAVWHGVITDLAGKVVPLAQVEVRSEQTGALVRIYEDREGIVSRSNPFQADAQGQVTIFAQGGAYKIIARSGPFERVWRYVGIGTAQEADIEGLGEYLQAGLAPVQTLEALNSIVPLNFPMDGVVFADPIGSNNGYYTNQGSGWVYARPLPDTFARLYVTGGTVDAVQATLDAGVNPSAPTVFFIDVLAANTGPVTLTINGANVGPVVNAAGAVLSAGEWQGRVLFTRETDGSYRIVNDPASAAAAAASASAAETARAAAVAAREAAQDSATAAGNSAGAAAGSAASAAGSATAAVNSAGAAAGSASTANTKAGEAADSAGAAAGSATAAGNSASAANTSAGQASTSATNAATSAGGASTSAGNALTEANRSKTEADRAETAAAQVDNPVSYNTQTPTTAEQAQARTNIGAVNTTTQTVGAAVAAANGQSTIDDGESVTGTLAGTSTLVRWTWGTVKAWIKGWITKADVGLGNVDNTADSDKPVSDAQAAADALRVLKANDTGLGGFTSALKSLGNLSGTTVALAATTSNFQIGQMDGSFTLAAPVGDQQTTILLYLWNSIGTMTATRFNKVNGSITPGKDHVLTITCIGTYKKLDIEVATS